MGTPRQMPSKEKISEFWNISLEECWRCGEPANRMDRAHIIDRSTFGNDAVVLDTEENLWMLCAPCHSVQPTFHIEEYNNALAWMNLDAYVYSEIYWNRPKTVKLIEESPELAEQAFKTVAGMLQSLWDKGLTNKGFSTIM